MFSGQVSIWLELTQGRNFYTLQKLCSDQTFEVIYSWQVVDRVSCAYISIILKVPKQAYINFPGIQGSGE